MLEISLLSTQMHTKEDNLSVTSDANTEDTGFCNSKENNSRSSNWPLGCMPLLPKFIRQGGTNKRSSKEVSLAQDHVPSIFEMKSKIKIGHMPILEDLHVRKCDLLDVLFLLEEKYNPTILPYLKTIEIEECDKLETIVAKREERMDMMNSFTQLESLNLEKLPNLIRFCKSLAREDNMGACEGEQRRKRRDPLIDGFLFPNLRSLFIQDCNKIGLLFSHSSLRSLERLEKLKVQDCKSIEEIVSQEEIEASVNKKIIFPGLQHLLLGGLPNLKAFSQGAYDFDFPSLQEVRIKGCPNMEVFSRGSSHTPKLEDFTVEIKPHSSNYVLKKDLNVTLQGFKKFVALQGTEILRWRKLDDEGVFGHFIEKSEMTVTRFDKLLRLVSFNEMHMLQHLKQLSIRDCDSLVEVFESEGGMDGKKGDATATTHYELQKMNLENLAKLSHIWGPNIMGHVSFKKLTSINIEECHSLKSLLSHSMARSLVQLQQLRVKDCNMMEEIVTKEDENTEEGSKVKTLFPKLKDLRLGYLPKLESVCSGDYDYDLPLCDVGEDKEMNNKQAEISFPELESLQIFLVPNLKSFCSGAYDYDLMLSSCCNEEIIEECPHMATSPNATVTVTTPNLHYIRVDWQYMRTVGDLNLTIHYIKNSEKYKAELQKLETFRCIERDEWLLGYITRETELVLESCDKLLNCVPSNMMHLFQHLITLRVRQCGCLEEIFESNDYEGDSMMMQYKLQSMELDSLPKLKHIWKNAGRVLGFQNLDVLIIRQCHDLKCVFPDLSIPSSLPNLNSLEVCECNKMEEIIQNKYNSDSVQEQQPKQAKIIFPNLWQLKLEKLPSLNCFCPSSCYFELPWCRKIIIEECPKMETFCSGTLYTPYLRALSVEKTEFGRDEEVNEVIQRIRQR